MDKPRPALYQLTKIRVLLFVREPEAVFWVIVFPLVLAMVLGWAFKSSEVGSEVVGIYAPAGEPSEFLALESAELLTVRRFTNREEALRAVRMGRVSVLIQNDGEAHKDRGIQNGDRRPTLIFDPKRPESELTRYRIERALDSGPTTSQPRFNLRELEERGSRYIDWLFPGLLGMNLMGTGIWGIGFAIADMRQKKLIRRFLVTPMRKSSFLLSFILSRGVFLVGELAILLAFAVWILGVPIFGSGFAFAALCLAGTLSFAAIGLLVVSRAQTIEAVSGLMNLVMVPMWLFSGVFFSYEKFPEFVHPLVRLLPLTALNDGLRGVMLEGVGPTELGPEFAVLGGWTVIAFSLALRWFRWR